MSLWTNFWNYCRWIFIVTRKEEAEEKKNGQDIEKIDEIKKKNEISEYNSEVSLQVKWKQDGVGIIFEDAAAFN